VLYMKVNQLHWSSDMYNYILSCEYDRILRRAVLRVKKVGLYW
jgi:hypothetical protein